MLEGVGGGRTTGTPLDEPIPSDGGHAGFGRGRDWFQGHVTVFLYCALVVRCRMLLRRQLS